MSNAPLSSECSQRTSRLSKGAWFAVPIALAGVAALCLRLELFAPPSAPPARGWRDGDPGIFEKDEPLQNIPVVVSTKDIDGLLTVTVANRGSTPLAYRGVGRFGIQLFWEFEEHGEWTAKNWDWCGMGKSSYELAPGEEVGLRVAFDEPRRERLLGCFTEAETDRSGLIVLATEPPQVSFDWSMLVLAVGAGTWAFWIWLGVRLVNRREPWAKWMLAGTVALPIIYVASYGPVRWLIQQLPVDGTPEWASDGFSWFYYPLIHSDIDVLGRYLDWSIDVFGT
jgi:hypothetical protein